MFIIKIFFSIFIISLLEQSIVLQNYSIHLYDCIIYVVLEYSMFFLVSTYVLETRNSSQTPFTHETMRMYRTVLDLLARFDNSLRLSKQCQGENTVYSWYIHTHTHLYIYSKCTYIHMCIKRGGSSWHKAILITVINIIHSLDHPEKLKCCIIAYMHIVILFTSVFFSTAYLSPKEKKKKKV